MKKTIVISTLFILAIAFAGCQAQPAQPTVTVPDKEAAAEPATAEQQASLEVTEGGETAEQQASLTITEGGEGATAEQEASLTITEGETGEPATAEQEASLTITE